MTASDANLDIAAIQSSFFAGGEFPIDQYSNTTIERDWKCPLFSTCISPQ
jgi:hypothetical protein